MPTSNTPGFPTGFIVLFVILAIIAVVGAIWRAVVLFRGGLNPMVAKEQLEVRLAQSLRSAVPATSGQPAKTTEERLAELDDLRARGVITAEERAVGRAKVIGGNLRRRSLGADLTRRSSRTDGPSPRTFPPPRPATARSPGSRNLGLRRHRIVRR